MPVLAAIPTAAAVQFITGAEFTHDHEKVTCRSLLYFGRRHAATSTAVAVQFITDTRFTINHISLASRFGVPGDPNANKGYRCPQILIERAAKSRHGHRSWKSAMFTPHYS
jgi:hypothetical protein